MGRRSLLALVLPAMLIAGGCSDTGSESADTTSSPTTVSDTTTTTVPPTTQTSPPTTVAVEEEQAADDGLTAEQMAFAEALVSEFNEGELGSFLELFDPDANVKTLLNPSKASTAGNIDLFREELAYRWALNAHWELSECKFEFGAIACGLLVSRDDLTDNSEPLTARLRITVDEDVVTILSLSEDSETIYATATAFYQWLAENHPDSVEAMWHAGSVPSPKLTDESIALWVELVPVFNASLDESTPAPGLEAVTFAEGLMADLNAGDVDAVAARFPDSVDVRSTIVTMETPSNWSAYGAAMESTWELGECKAVAGDATRCEWLRTSEHESYYPESRSVVMQFRLESGVPTYAIFTLPLDSSVAAEAAFTDWMIENHPIQANELYWNNGDAGYYEQRMVNPLEEADIKKKYVPLWRATLDE